MFKREWENKEKNMKSLSLPRMYRMKKRQLEKLLRLNIRQKNDIETKNLNNFYKNNNNNNI